LRRARIETIGQLLSQSAEELLSLTNFGQKSLDEIIEKLDERGLALPNKH
jgi:DNA-directed RNA polymerase subunit alpha